MVLLCPILTDFFYFFTWGRVYTQVWKGLPSSFSHPVVPLKPADSTVREIGAFLGLLK